LGSFSERGPPLFRHSASTWILHAVVLAYLKSKPANVTQCKSKTNLYTDDSLVVLVSAYAGKTAFRPSFFRGDTSRLTQSRNVLQGIPHIVDTAARGVPEFTADVRSFKNTFEHCAKTHLHIFIMIRFSDQNSKVKTKKDNGRRIGTPYSRSVSHHYYYYIYILRLYIHIHTITSSCDIYSSNINGTYVQFCLYKR
jgi:hypothetical protein